MGGKERRKVAQFTGRRTLAPAAEPIPNPARMVEIRKSASSPPISTFPISGYVPELIEAAGISGIVTRDDLIGLLAGHARNVGIAHRSTDDFLYGAAFASFNGPMGATSVARILAAASNTPLDSVYESFAANRTDPVRITPAQLPDVPLQGKKRTGRNRPATMQSDTTNKGQASAQGKNLAAYPVATAMPNLISALTEKGIEGRTTLIQLLAVAGVSLKAATIGTDKFLKGKVYLNTGRLSRTGSAIFNIAGIAAPSPDISLLPRTSSVSKTGPRAAPRRASASGEFPIFAKLPDLRQTFAQRDVQTRSQVADILLQGGVPQHEAKIGASSFLDGKLFVSTRRDSPLTPAARMVLTVLDHPLPHRTPKIGKGKPARDIKALHASPGSYTAPRRALDDPFTEGLLKLAPQLKLLAVKLTRDRSKAEDLVQDTFANALEARDKFHVYPDKGYQSSLGAWAGKIMHNRFISDLPRMHNRNTGSLTNDDGSSAIDSYVSVPERQIDILHLKEVVTSFKALPEDQRTAIVQVGYHELTHNELASNTGAEAGTAKSRVFRARKKLRADFSMPG